MAERKRNADGQLYTSLPEAELSALLARLAIVQSPSQDTDVVSFQPCPIVAERSQDRHCVADWALSNGVWRFRATFDGHAGHETVDYAVETIPAAIRDALTTALTNGPLDPTEVTNLLRNTVAAADAKIGDEFLALFPGGPEAVESMSEEEIVAIINDGGPNNKKTLRCMRGSTVLIALISPELDVWVGSLGDCQAVLGAKQGSGEWTTTVLSTNHNGVDPAEAERIRSEHPGEPEAVLRDRVLGALAVTRAMGDFLFKLPSVYTTQVFLKSKPGFRFSSNLAEFLPRNLTPPYVSAICEIQHINIASIGATEAYLLLASDGLVDLTGDTFGVEYRVPEMCGKKWVEVLARSDRSGNDALHLLRDVMGQEPDKVSSLLTVESEQRWIDDTTIVLTKLC